MAGNTATEEVNPSEMAGANIPDEENADASNVVSIETPHDRLLTKGPFNIPPRKSLYHTERAQAARQRAETELPEVLAETMQSLFEAGLKRANPAYADVADHNSLTLAYALKYAACGLHVVDSHAIDPKTGEGTGPQASAKLPRGSKWQERASDDATEITAFWTGDGEYPPTKSGEVFPYSHVSAPRNVSIAFPEGCGLFVLDIDGEAGKQALRELEAEHGPLPRTAKSVTGSGGWHFIFQTSRPIRNTASQIATGVDIRGSGGQIIATPSIHKTGNFYQWDVTPWDVIAEAPEWLEELAFAASKRNATTTKTKAKRKTPSNTSRTCASGFENHLATIGDHDGGFDMPIYRAACSWFAENGAAEDSTELVEMLRAKIEGAKRDPERDRSKYDTDEYILHRIEQAREYIAGQSDEDGPDGPTSDIVTANPLDPIYDERLVNSGGFLHQPEDAVPLYKEYGLKVPKTKTDENGDKFDKAYRKMAGILRSQIKEAMRARFSYVVTPDGAKAAIKPAKGAPPVFYSEGALERLFRNREISYGDGKKLKPATLFFYDRERETFDGTCFDPASAGEEHKFNIWTGFAVEPAKGDWSLLKTHIRDLLCGGDEELFAWFMTWIASPFARPDAKVPSSVAVRGEQGTGKSKLFDWLREAMGCAALKVSQGKHLVGSFNAHLDGKLLLVCEEAFWAGDKAAAGVIKDLITSENLTVEAKFENAVTRPNRLAVAFISNNDWIIPTDGKDARRFLVLEASNARKEDAAYFKAIDAQMENGGVEAMMYDLMNWDPSEIGGWDVLRKPPKTDSLREQARMGLSGPTAVLLSIIDEGVLEGRAPDGDAFYYDLSDEEPTRVARSHVNAVLGIKKGRGNETLEGRSAMEEILGDGTNHRNKDVIRYNGEMQDGSRVDKQTGNRVFYVEFPPLKDLAGILSEYGERFD